MIRLGNLKSEDGLVELTPCHSRIVAHFMNGQNRGKTDGLRAKPNTGDTVVLQAGPTGEWYILGVLSVQTDQNKIKIHEHCLIQNDQITLGSSKAQFHLSKNSMEWKHNGHCIFNEITLFLKSLLETQSQCVATCLGPGTLNPAVAEKAQEVLTVLKKLKGS